MKVLPLPQLPQIDGQTNNGNGNYWTIGSLCLLLQRLSILCLGKKGGFGALGRLMALFEFSWSRLLVHVEGDGRSSCAGDFAFKVSMPRRDLVGQSQAPALGHETSLSLTHTRKQSLFLSLSLSRIEVGPRLQCAFGQLRDKM